MTQFKNNQIPLVYETDTDKPIYVDKTTGDVWQRGMPKGGIMLPEVRVTRPKYSSAYDGNAIRPILDWVPGVGDALQGIDVADALQKKDYLQAGVLGGMFLLPNFLEKPLKWTKQGIKKLISKTPKKVYTAPSLQVKKDVYSDDLDELPILNNFIELDFQHPSVEAYKELSEFYNSKEYKERLINYLKNVEGLKKDDEIQYRVNDLLKELEHNLKTVKLNIDDLKKVPGKPRGLYHKEYHLVAVDPKYMDNSKNVWLHELIHSSDQGTPFLDNPNYKMLTGAEQDIINNNWKDLDNLTDIDRFKAKHAHSDKNYYGDIVEQRPRVLLTLMDMRKKGFNINNLTQKDIDAYYKKDLFDSDWPQFNLFMRNLPDNIKQLKTKYTNQLPALQNFKTMAVPFTLGITGYGLINNQKQEEELYRNGNKNR